MDGNITEKTNLLQAMFERQKLAFSFATVPSIAERKQTLLKIEALVRSRKDDIVAALNADFGTRSAAETLSSEVAMVINTSKYLRKHLSNWASPQRKTNGSPIPGKAITQYQPKGVVGIISPWNYPFQLAMVPLLTAIAAGNSVILKPSEITPTTAALLADLFEGEFDPSQIAVAIGGRDVGEQFSTLPFDHLFYTGSTRVGRLVAMAAAKNLTPVTLELGGKSPCVLLPDADIAEAVKTIAFGKFYNAGQTCVAPDYLLVPKDKAQEIGAALIASVSAFYPNIRTNEDYSSIISDAHYARLNGLVSDAVERGSQLLRVESDEQAMKQGRKIAPTVILNPPTDSAIMAEEIFGPIIPIIEYDSVDDAVRFITERDHPLALYVYGGTAAANDLLNRTTSGGACINATVIHLTIESLPFGGVGKSGYGAYHGENGFREFSHERAIFNLPTWLPKSLITPPYSKIFHWLVNRQIG